MNFIIRFFRTTFFSVLLHNTTGKIELNGFVWKNHAEGFNLPAQTLNHTVSFNKNHGALQSQVSRAWFFDWSLWTTSHDKDESNYLYAVIQINKLGT